MKAGWEVKALGDVCRLINGRAYKKPELLAEGKYPVLRVGNFFTNNHWYYSDLELDKDKYCDDGDLLYAWSASFGPRIWQGGKVIFHYHIWKVEPLLEELDQAYLYYFFDWDKDRIKEEQGAGATMIHVSKKSMDARAIPLPPLEEQKQIVAVLDAAFEGLTRARTHIETNLQNARELLDGGIKTNLEQATEGWIQAPLEKCFRLKSGDNLTSKAMVSGQYDVYGGNGVAGQHNQTNLTGQNVIVGRVGALCGRARCITEDIWLTDNAFKVTDPKFDFNFEFLARLLNFKDLRSLARQAAQPVISNSSLKDLTLSFPEDIGVQNEIANTISELETETENLQSHYRQKLQDLDDLRQSLLQKAFAGELT